MVILACGCTLGAERCFDCRPGLDPDQRMAIARTRWLVWCSSSHENIDPFVKLKQFEDEEKARI